MRKLLIIAIFCLTYNWAYGQQSVKRSNQWVDIAATAGSSQGSVAASYVHTWKVGKRKKIEAGLGARFITMFGEKINYTTAPARLARTNATPFLIVFAGQKFENWDTLTVQRPLVNSLNLSLNFGYNFNSRWSAIFNIDLLGFSFGKKTAAIFTSNGITRTEPGAKPTNFNVLLTGDLDYGSLNSEYSVKYKLNNRWAIRAVYQFLFTEYKTSTIKQTAPDGTKVERFRNKANNFGAAVSYNL